MIDLWLAAPRDAKVKPTFVRVGIMARHEEFSRTLAIINALVRFT